MSSNATAVSAIVVCFNEEDRIGACLESLRWCDEIVVVDSFSTDRTPEICRRYTERFYQRPWAGYRDQKAHALSLATKDWVITVDADERVSEKLRAELCDALMRDGNTYAGYSLPRLVYYLDRWWWRSEWFPDHSVRLFRRDRVTWGGTEPHDKILVDGKVRRLRHPLEHFTYRNMADHIQRQNRYSSISARESLKAGQRWRLSDALLRPAVRFVRSYFFKRGFMEGFAGFYVAATGAFYVFLKYAKLWELELEKKRQAKQRQP